MRKNSRLLWTALATLLPLGGCGGIGIGFPSWSSGGPTGPDPFKDGWVQILPTSLTLRVNESRTVVAHLDGRIASFVHFDWRATSSSIRLTPGACSEIANQHRGCSAEITAVTSGAAKVTFSVGLSEYRFADVRVSLDVSVLP
jgi:hypothetical protein